MSADRPGPVLSLLAALGDLVLPGGCAGCAGGGGQPLRWGVCADCSAAVERLHPRAVRPDPEPEGLPPCAAQGEYADVLRELVLAYKDRGRHRLSRPLGRILAHVVTKVTTEPVALVPVPDTPAAARARHGDHLWRLARPAAARLRACGVPVVLARALRATPRPDSAGLDAAARAAQAAASLRVRPARATGLRRWQDRTGGHVVLLDDVITTGSTLAAAAGRLAGAGVPVTGAAVLAATRRHRPASPDRMVVPGPVRWTRAPVTGAE